MDEGRKSSGGERRRPGDLEDFFEHGAIPLHIVGVDGTLLRANTAELDLLGYPADEYIGQPIAKFHVDAPVIEDILARLIRGETIRRYPARLRARDGSIKHVEITSSGQFSEGSFVNTRCFTIDITDLVEARAEARRKDDQLRQVLDALPAAVFMVDVGGKLTYVNEAARALVRHEPMLGKDDWHTVFPLFTSDGKEVPREDRPMTVALEENRPVWGVEVLARKPDGTLVPLMAFPTPIRSESGSLAGAVNMFVDISERKQAEEMFRLAVDAAPSGMILADAEGRILLVNGEAEELFGYGQAELVGQTIEKLLPPRFRERHVTLREVYARKPDLRSMSVGREFIAVRKDGAEVPVEIGLSPITTSRGLTILSTIVDRSERRRAAERERLLVRELHHRSSNVFAVVQAIITHSLSGDMPIEMARRALQARLQALARTHRSLIEANWNGLALSEVVRAELEPFSDRVTFDGVDVVLEPRQAQDFSLALHELTTNAAKYGALSVPEGHIDVRWSKRETDHRSLLQFHWQERGGPSVAPPDRRGFGSALLKSVFSDATIDFDVRGLTCKMALIISDESAPCRR